MELWTRNADFTFTLAVKFFTACVFGKIHTRKGAKQMTKYEQERIEQAETFLAYHMQVNKRTGEIKKSRKPYYRGKQLSDVYGRYSENKEIAYKNCEKILEQIGWEFVTSRGITSANCYSFTYAATIELENKYVIFFSSTKDNLSYMGDKYNSCCMNIKAYLMEE